MNKELMRKILTQIEETPEKWNQRTWSNNTACGTTLCVAGWACVLSGYRLISPQEDVPAAEDYVRRSDVRSDEMFLIETLGRDLLELDRDQAEELFYTTDHEEVLNILRVWSE